MSSTAPRGTDVKNKLPPNKTNNNKEIPAVPSGPTFPPSAVSNPGTIGTGPSFRPESNPNGSDFFGGIGSASFSSSSLLLLVAVVVLFLHSSDCSRPPRRRGRKPVAKGGGRSARRRRRRSLSLFYFLAQSVCVCVSVCLSFFSFVGSGVKNVL